MNFHCKILVDRLRSQYQRSFDGNVHHDQCLQNRFSCSSLGHKKSTEGTERKFQII